MTPTVPDPAPPERPPRVAGISFILITVFLDVLSIGIIIPVLPELVKEFAGGDTSAAGWYVGIIAASYALMQFLFAPILGGLSDQYGRRPILLIAMFGLGVDFLVQAFAPNLGLVIRRSDFCRHHGGQFFHRQCVRGGCFDSLRAGPELRFDGDDVWAGLHFWSRVRGLARCDQRSVLDRSRSARRGGVSFAGALFCGGRAVTLQLVVRLFCFARNRCRWNHAIASRGRR
jgi:hypothetical protein